MRDKISKILGRGNIVYRDWRTDADDEELIIEHIYHLKGEYVLHTFTEGGDTLYNLMTVMSNGKFITYDWDADYTYITDQRWIDDAIGYHVETHGYALSTLDGLVKGYVDCDALVTLLEVGVDTNVYKVLKGGMWSYFLEASINSVFKDLRRELSEARKSCLRIDVEGVANLGGVAELISKIDERFEDYLNAPVRRIADEIKDAAQIVEYYNWVDRVLNYEMDKILG